MNAEETKRAAAVMIAHAEGKRIERQSRSEGDWADCPQPVWNWYSRDYRIAPEPIEVEVWVHPDGRILPRAAILPSNVTQATRMGWALRRATIHPETK